MSLIARGEKAINERYRPMKFSEVIGCEKTKQALTKWMERGKLRSRALLLYGESGCGKSTLSRIIAMGLNCEKGDTVEPCLECPSCKAALAGEALHINEFNMSALSCKDDADNIVNSMQNACFTGRNRVYIMDECLHYNTMIDCFIDGKVKRIPIGHIVHKKMNVNVLSYNNEKQIIEVKPVVNWFKNPKKEVYEWIFERTDEPCSNGSKKVLTCTDNHTVFLRDTNEEVQIGTLKKGDIIRGNYVSMGNRIKSIQKKRKKYVISSEANQVLLGTLLGDSSIGFGSNDSNFVRITGIHCEEQKFYALEKVRIFGDLFSSGKDIINDGYQKGNVKEKKAYRFRTKSVEELNEYYDMFYKNFNLPKILSQLGEIGIAIWYMDDGSLSGGTTVNLSTYSYSEKENNEIIDFFQKKYDIQFKKIFDKRIQKYSIYCCGENKDKFLRLVSPYILSEFQYKCGNEKAGNKIKLINPIYTIGKQEGNYVECGYRFIEKRTNPKKNERGHVYDIEVADNHNYFASGINVHNCQGMSTGSQNLLLKTLENPPEGVYIIICTTNPEKLLKTVRARCEQYEFKNPSINDIKLLLAAVVKQEMPEMNIEQRKEILDACLGLSYREILMKLDKFIKGGGTDNISEAFQANYFDFAKMVLKGDYPAVLKYIDESKDNFDIEAARRMLRVFLCNQISYSPWCANAIKSAQAFRIFDKGFYTDPNPMPSFKVDLFEACNLFRKTE